MSKIWAVMVIFLFTTVFSMTGFTLDVQAVGENYEPLFQASVVGSNVVKAGEINTVHINLENISTDTGAWNIVYVPVKNGTTINSSKAVTDMPIKKIAIDSSADMELSIDVNRLAESGVFSFKFQLTSINAWNIGFPAREYSVDLMIENTNTRASLGIEVAGNQSISAQSGGTFKLPLVVKNFGSYYAKDVKIALKGLSQDKFTITSGTGRYDFSRIDGYGTKNIDFDIKVAAGLKSGSYPLEFSLDYTDEKGNTVSGDVQQLWIPVSGSGEMISTLEVLEVTPSKTSVKPGESFNVTVKVKNSGNYAASQIKVSAEANEALLPVSQNLFIISSLKQGETRDVIFNFQPKPDAARGGVPITVKVEQLNGGENSTIARAISVFVDSTSDGKTEAGKNVPKIIVSNYSSEPTLVKAGERFTLKMQFMNTHASRSVRNIKGNFVVTEASNETGSVFSPVESSNTFYIDSISPKDTTEWELTLYTIPDAKSKTYTITISFEYEDDAGNPYKADELIGIPVYQPSRFETSEISLPPEAFMGQPMFVGFEMYNMGKTDIYNVKLSVEGDFDAQPKSNYFGNFESGRREFFEMNIIPQAVGEAKGRIVFQYETASGEKQELVKELSFNVMEMMMPPEMPVDGKPMPGGPDMENPQGKSISVWLYVILVVVVGGGVAAFILIKRRRKKKEEFDF